MMGLLSQNVCIGSSTALPGGNVTIVPVRERLCPGQNGESSAQVTARGRSGYWFAANTACRDGRLLILLFGVPRDSVAITVD